MYKEYTTRNLNEYYKIVAAIESCDTLAQFEVARDMVDIFGNNCDFRYARLKRQALSKLSYTKYKEFRAYHESTKVQIETLIRMCEAWARAYDEWLDMEARSNAEREEELKKMPPKKEILGFGALLKKNKRKKYE
jgi:hypothetical protein